MKEIYNRRSIRKFKNTPVSDAVIRELIICGIKAPSAKNRQPWKFIIVTGESKAAMLQAFCEGLKRETVGKALLPGSSRHRSGALHTVSIMEQAPVILLVVNPLGSSVFSPIYGEERVYDTANVQSIGAAIQNILLAAEEKGLGSLWICDIFFAYPELTEWLGEPGGLVAAVALGYPMESPPPRPRNSLEEVISWRR